MKTRKFALCLAAVFLVMIYINIQRNHTFTLSDDEGTIKTEQIQNPEKHTRLETEQSSPVTKTEHCSFNNYSNT